MNSGLLGFPLGRDQFHFDDGIVEEYALVQRWYPQGVGGGGMGASSTWIDSPFTRIVTDKAELVAKLTAAGGIMLRPGRYHCSAFCQQMSTEAAHGRVYDITSSRFLAYQPSYAGQGGGRLHMTTIFMDDEFVLYRDSEVRMQQIASSARGDLWTMGHYTVDTATGSMVHGAIQLWRVPDR